jgi:uncharacterized protein
MEDARVANLCWAISDGAAGNERQALALVRALGVDARVLRLHVARPWRWFAPRLQTGAAWAIRDQAGLSLTPPWPDLAIGCGRQAALLTRTLRRWSSGRSFCVQILDPRIDPKHFDLVVAPQHDDLHGANVIQTLGALNPIDASWLTAGRERFAELAGLPAPRTAVLIGASNRAQRLDPAYFSGLLKKLAQEQANSGGSFLVTASRRTPALTVYRLRAEFARFPGRFWAGPQDGENPYAGFLAHAQRIVVTPDSANMLSEACAVGVPVYTFCTQDISGKLAMLHQRLTDQGHLRHLGESAGEPAAPLAETQAVAAQVRECWERAR